MSTCDQSFIRPTNLQKGDQIGIISTARKISKEELEFSMKSSRHQEYVRKEMDKIRKEGKIKDLYEIIREAERRVNNE